MANDPKDESKSEGKADVEPGELSPEDLEKIAAGRARFAGFNVGGGDFKAPDSGQSGAGGRSGTTTKFTKD